MDLYGEAQVGASGTHEILGQNYFPGLEGVPVPENKKNTRLVVARFCWSGLQPAPSLLAGEQGRRRRQPCPPVGTPAGASPVLWRAGSAPARAAGSFCWLPPVGAPPCALAGRAGVGMCCCRPTASSGQPTPWETPGAVKF